MSVSLLDPTFRMRDDKRDFYLDYISTSYLNDSKHADVTFSRAVLFEIIP